MQFSFFTGKGRVISGIADMALIYPPFLYKKNILLRMSYVYVTPSEISATLQQSPFVLHGQQRWQTRKNKKRGGLRWGGGHDGRHYSKHIISAVDYGVFHGRHLYPDPHTSINGVTISPRCLIPPIWILNPTHATLVPPPWSFFVPYLH
ncbi:unnamed protein product [Cuscuta epithymum]|uniref:Uncharacterized protein n=1 Tax=Cuscuta epithymum TaxID=186058 RepID=A0AAV0FFG5_9ASTE|nr:unnamed protein product [Cuscuta epithymum]